MQRHLLHPTAAKRTATYRLQKSYNPLKQYVAVSFAAWPRLTKRSPACLVVYGTSSDLLRLLLTTGAIPAAGASTFCFSPRARTPACASAVHDPTHS
jgi:hypothetical protein